MKVYKVLINFEDGTKDGIFYLDKFGYYKSDIRPHLALLPDFVENNPHIFQLLKCCNGHQNITNAVSAKDYLDEKLSYIMLTLTYLGKPIFPDFKMILETYAEKYHKEKLEENIEFIKDNKKCPFLR